MNYAKKNFEKIAIVQKTDQVAIAQNDSSLAYRNVFL